MRNHQHHPRIQHTVSRLKRAGKTGAACLLLAGFLCGCGSASVKTDGGTATAAPNATVAPVEQESIPAAPSPTPTPTPAPTPSPEPTPDPEALEQEAREQRLREAKDGFLWEEGALQAVDAEGNLIRDDYIGVLYFDPAGTYTSGNEELDALVANIISENTDSGMTRMEMLRAMYDYVLEHVEYAGLNNYENSRTPAHGKDGWMPKSAIQALKNHAGNCYCFASALTALARGLGYQAYAAGGVMGGNEEPHGWSLLVQDDGTVLMSDPQIQNLRIRRYDPYDPDMNYIPDLFYKTQEEIGIETGIDYQAQVDPFAAEAEEAAERARQAGLPDAEAGGSTEAADIADPAGNTETAG